MKENKNNKPKREHKSYEIKLGHFSDELARALNIRSPKDDNKRRNKQAKRRANA